MSKTGLGETEKTVLVGALILAGWLGFDAWIRRIEKHDMAASGSERAIVRRAQAVRARRRGRKAA